MDLRPEEDVAAPRQRYRQGDLDSFCGAYAIINALRLCGLENSKKLQDAFVDALGALSSRRWPSLLKEGTGHGDMQRMIKRLSSLMDSAGISVSYPFLRNSPGSNGEYWERADVLFADPTARVAIIGVCKPRDHWIVAQPAGDRVKFTDSSGDSGEVIKDRAELHAGARRPRLDQWLIEPDEFILFRRV